MDPVSGLKGELFRPLTTIIVPGIFAISPYIVIAFIRFPELQPLLQSSVGMGFLLFFLALLAGMLLEDIGSSLESFLWRTFASTAERNEEWVAYLKLRTKDEIVGQRYLRTLQTRLKFELSMVPSLFVFVIGANWLNSLYGDIPQIQMLLMSSLFSGILVYLGFEAYSSIVLLADVRKCVIASCGNNNSQIVPCDCSNDQNAETAGRNCSGEVQSSENEQEIATDSSSS